MVFSSQSTLLLFKRIFPYGKPLNLFSQFPKPFTSLPQPPSAPNTPNPSSLSAKMSFVFDQIDAIEREREEKDQTLQRIRAWRESKKINISDKEVDISDKKIDFSAKSSGEEFEVKGLLNEENGLGGIEKEVELVHPWKEWIELIERLVGQKYFDYKRRDEDAMMEDSGFRLGEVEGEVRRPDFTKDWRTVETAVLNFGRDRFDILRSLARQDLQILVGYGCPSTDKRTTFAAKVLRKYVHLDEGDVCSSCSLRSSCERAYLLTNKEDEARTIDVMRILLTYGFDPINGPVLNKSLQKLKSVKTIVRKLLHEVVKLSAVPVDPNLSPPVFKKPPPKVKQPPPAPKKRVGRDDIEMKKGDWLCPKCDFMNFAKNTICLQCDAKRPKRQLLPGEWECPRCNFLNYRRNVVCFHCECNRPQDEYMESHIQEKQSGSRMRTGKVLNRQEVSNAWNFNFDDDESDGADVASFENADSSKRNEDFSMDKQALGRISEGYQDSYNNSGHTRMYERNNSSSVPMKSGTGFNDFSDEDDDVDNYEVDNRNESERASHVDFSDLEANSGSDSENGDSSRHAPRRTSLNDGNNPSRRGNHKSAFSRSKDAELDFGSDDDLPIHPNWKSSHVANPKQRNKHGGALSFGSDEDIGSDNEGMDGGFRSSRRVKDRQGDNRNRTFSDFGSDDERDFNTVKRSGASSTRNTSKGGALRGGRRQFSGTDDANYSRNAHDNGKSSFDRERSDGRRGNSQSFGGSNMRSQNQQQGRGALRGGRGQFTGTDDKYSRNARDNGKSSFDRQRSDGRRGNSQSLGGSNTRSHQERGRSTDRDSYYDDERFQKPRNNVR